MDRQMKRARFYDPVTGAEESKVNELCPGGT
jgi:hypothetical protein